MRTRMRKQLALLLGLATIMNAGVLVAAPLSLEDARSAALSVSKALKRANLTIDSSLLDERALSYELLPSLSAKLGLSTELAKLDSPADSLSGSASLSVSESIWDGGAHPILAAIDKLATQSAREAARAAYFQVLDDVDDAYFSLLEAQASVEAANKDLDAASLALDLEQTKWEAGTVTKASVLEAEASVESAKTTLNGARRDVSVYRAKLASLTKRTDVPDLASFDFSHYEPLISALEVYEDTDAARLIGKIQDAALAAHPALAQVKLSQEQAEEAVRLAERDYWPSLDASWSTGLSASSSGLDADYGSLSISASIPLDWWTTKTAVAQKRLAASQAALETGEEQESLLLDASAAVYDCINLARTIKSSRKATEYAEAHYEAVLEQYRLSTLTRSDLYDAEVLLSSNRKSLIQARFQFLASLSSLRTLGAFQSDDAVEEALR